MKIKLSNSDIQRIVSNPDEAQKAKVNIDDPWWVIALKVAAYLIGLLLAGIGTAQAATTLF